MAIARNTKHGGCTMWETLSVVIGMLVVLGGIITTMVLTILPVEAQGNKNKHTKLEYVEFAEYYHFVENNTGYKAADVVLDLLGMIIQGVVTVAVIIWAFSYLL